MPGGLIPKKQVMIRLVPAVFAAALLLIWTVWQAKVHWVAQTYEDLPEDADPSQLLELSAQIPPVDPNYYIRISNTLSKRIFPSNHPGALTAAEKALQLDPRNSRLWMVVAREKLYLGDDDQARSALEFSDRLDPRWPRQRLESVRLWTLLGDPERGLKTADHVAALGPEFQIEVARELLSSGYDPKDVFDQLGVYEMPAEDIGEIIEAIRTPSLSQMEAIYSRIPDEAYKNPEFRRELVAIASKPLSMKEILKLWSWESPYVLDMGEGIWLENAELRHPPFGGGDFPLGWINIPETTEVQGKWMSPAVSDSGDGHIELSFPPYATNRFEFKLYRLPVPSGERFDVSVHVRCVTDAYVETRLIAHVGEQQFNSEKSDPELSGWQELTATLPLFEKPQMVTLQLNWNRLASGGREPDRLLIDGIDVRPSVVDLRPSSFSQEEPAS